MGLGAAFDAAARGPAPQVGGESGLAAQVELLRATVLLMEQRLTLQEERISRALAQQ